MLMITLRIFGYMVLIVLLTEAMRLEARLLTREQLYSELGFVELGQALLVATMSTLFGPQCPLRGRAQAAVPVPVAGSWPSS